MPNTKHNFNSMIVIDALYGMFRILRIFFLRLASPSIDLKTNFLKRRIYNSMPYFLQLLFSTAIFIFVIIKKYFRKNEFVIKFEY